MPQVVGCLVCVSQRKAFTDLINLENYMEQGVGRGDGGRIMNSILFLMTQFSSSLTPALSHSLSETSILIFEILVIHA